MDSITNEEFLKVIQKTFEIWECPQAAQQDLYEVWPMEILTAYKAIYPDMDLIEDTTDKKVFLSYGKKVYFINFKIKFNGEFCAERIYE